MWNDSLTGLVPEYINKYEAKHFCFAGGPGGPSGSGSGAGPSPDPDESSDEGYGFTGQQGYGVSSTDDAGLNVGWGQAPISVAETAAMEDISTTPTPTATEQTAATEEIGAKKGALANAIAAQEEAEEDSWSSAKDTALKALTLASVAKGVLDVAATSNPFGLLATAFGYVAGKAMSEEGTTDATADPDTTMGPTPSDPGQDDPVGDTPAPAPGPDTSPDGGDDIPPRRAVVRAASNNVTLAVGEEGDFTRQQLRRARKQITRFA